MRTICLVTRAFTATLPFHLPRFLSLIDVSEILVGSQEQFGDRLEGRSAALKLIDPELFAGHVAGAAEEVAVIGVEDEAVGFGGGQKALGQRCSTYSRC